MTGILDGARVEAREPEGVLSSETPRPLAAAVNPDSDKVEDRADSGRSEVGPSALSTSSADFAEMPKFAGFADRWLDFREVAGGGVEGASPASGLGGEYGTRRIASVLF
jgi:hypothetical protein